MSIQSEIDRIKNNVIGVYSAVSDMGGTLPDEQNSDNLAGAVRSIPQGVNLPLGGETGSILSKLSDDDNDIGWETLFAIGLKLMELSNPVGSVLNNPESHRNIFRGKNLGTALTAEQKANIQNGTFKNLWLGDYWVINGVNWRIVDMDYWWNCGDTAFTKHHLVIMPDANLGANKQMNTTKTTEGGYVGSLMYTSNMNDAKTLCTGAFGANILSHREYLVNAAANGKPSAAAWMDSTIELPNECMIYGHPHFTPACYGTTVPTIYTIDKTQLALFAVVPKFIATRQNYWLRDVVSSDDFALVGSNGLAAYNSASYAHVGVRPVFPVG